ncbi:MAG: MogA/MoaB family molybdenum cofactor biosynthesis protein [ANME-2 cluster archaeon]|nr:MogA/MoaB family molybdenum cofactor biosynthesis protein [ANME-2 cluster archaeon]
MSGNDTPALHKQNAPTIVNFAIITVSTSRYKTYGSVAAPRQADDISGTVMMDLISGAGFEVVTYSLLPDNEALIAGKVRELVRSGIHIIVISGGTGLAPEDVTLEAVEPLFCKTIPGFGELFRMKSLEDVGTAAILSRASAGIVDRCAVFCLPGSPAAVELALNELIIPEAAHIVKHI